MIKINIKPNSSLDNLMLLQEKIGGSISSQSNQYTLSINNDIATGNIIYSQFDWGIDYMDIRAKFYEDVVIETTSTKFNPLRFMYVMKGHFGHRFGTDNIERRVDELHSLIFTNKGGGKSSLHFPRNIFSHINLIQVERKVFLKKKSTNVSSLNDRLHEVFVDTDQEHRFAHFGALNLRIGDFIQKIDKIKEKGMVKTLKMEALLYEILSFHIQQHNKSQLGVPLPTSLSSRELKIIRKIGKDIIKNPSFQYSLTTMSLKSGLSQAKLQEGFKFLYKRTVTEYVRHIRLEKSRELLNAANLNISQVVYTIGFTSRSYFSKIFKEKYNISPNEFRKNIIKNVIIDEKAA